MLKELKLNKCNIVNGKSFNKILKSVQECYLLNTVEMDQDWSQNQTIVFMDNFK